MFGKKLICPKCGSKEVQPKKHESKQYECLKPGCGFSGTKEKFQKKRE